MAGLNTSMTVEIDARKIEVNPGSKVFAEYPYILTAGQRERIRREIAKWAGIPDESVLLLDGGCKLRVLSKEEADVSTSNP